ncbi:MAG: hypothetical protein IJ621_02990 [Paludibacteraceae bacterium]|nr:hypothetical protein [Paludibacteraceae bacterium]
MKRIIFFLTICLVFAACEKKEEVKEQPKTTEYRVAGTLAIQMGPNSFANPDTMLVTVDEKQQVLSVAMLQVKFSDKMPVALDVFADNLPYLDNNNTLLVEQDTVVLTWGPEHAPYLDCPLADFRDTLDIASEEMRFNCTFAHKKMGDMPARFVGKFIK